MTINPHYALRVAFAPEGLGDGGASPLIGGAEYTEPLSSFTANAVGAAVTVLADGGHVLTWSEQDNGVYTSKWQRFDASGNAVTAVNDIPGTDSSVTALAGGGFAIAYSTSWQGLLVQRFDGDSLPVGTPVVADTSLYGMSPTITGLPDGGFVLTWTGYPVSGQWEDGVLVRRFDAQGNPLGSAEQVNTETSGNQVAPSVTVLADGGFVIAWQTQVQGSYGIAMRRYDANGVSATGTEVAVNPATSNEFNPVVTALADGGWVVTWSSDKDDMQDVYGQIYNADGNARGSELHLAIPGYQALPSVTALEDGGFMLAWGNNDPNTGDNDIIAQRFDADGTTVGNSFTVNQTLPGTQGAPVLAGRADGGFVVAWQTDGAFSYDPSNPGSSYQMVGGTVSVRVFESDAGNAQVQNLVSAMAAFAPSPQGHNDVVPLQPEQIQPIIASSLT